MTPPYVCYLIEAHRRAADGRLIPLGVSVKEVDQPIPFSISDQSEWFNPLAEELTDFAYYIKFSLPLSADHEALVAQVAEKHGILVSELNQIVAGAEVISLDGSCPFCNPQVCQDIAGQLDKLKSQVEALRANQEDLMSLAGSRCSGCASNALVEPAVRSLTILLSQVNLRDRHLQEELEKHLEELTRACEGFDKWGSDYDHTM